MNDFAIPQPTSLNSLAKIREAYPEYDDMSDMELLTKLHKKHYSDMDFQEFVRGIEGAPAVTVPRSDDELFNLVMGELGNSLEPASGYVAEPMKNDVNWSGRGRAMAQGATFALADEAEALLRSTFSGKDYDTVLGEVRTALDEYRKENPGDAVAAELTGVALPVVASLLLTKGLATPAVVATSARTGRLAPLIRGLFKSGALGATEGAAYAFNAGQGGFGNRAMETPKGAGFGAVGGMAGYGAATAAGSAFNRLLRFTEEKYGPRMTATVEREFRQLATDSGLSVDDIVRGIEVGKFPAEMGGNKTMATAARAFRDQSRAAGSILEDAYKGRTNDLRTRMLDTLRRELAQTDDPNVIKAITMQIDDLTNQQSAQYNQVWQGAAPLEDDVIQGLQDALKRSPEAGSDAAKIYRAETGNDPFFRFDKETGQVVFDRQPTLQEAEIIRRGIKDVANREYRTGSGEVGQAVTGVERNVRGLLDDASPELKDVRQGWANIMANRDAFEEGRKALSGNPDQVAIRVGELKPDELSAYRAGVAAAYRAKGFTGAGKSLPRNLLDEGRKEGAVLRLVFPEDNLEDFLKLTETTVGAMDAEGVILGGSQTSTNLGRNVQTNAGALATAAENVSQQGLVGASLNAVLSALKKAKPQLSDKQLQELAKLMVETDPEAFQRAMSGAPSARAVQSFVDRQIDRLVPAASQFSRRATGGAANPFVNSAARELGMGLLEG